MTSQTTAGQPIIAAANPSAYFQAPESPEMREAAVNYVRYTLSIRECQQPAPFPCQCGACEASERSAEDIQAEIDEYKRELVYLEFRWPGVDIVADRLLARLAVSHLA